jgi:hypothetical protein
MLDTVPHAAAEMPGVGDRAVRPATPRPDPCESSNQIRPLPSWASSPADLDGRWVVALLAKANHEQRVIKLLEAAEVGFFLPLQDVDVKDKKTNHRRKEKRPLFGGYVFACLDAERTNRYVLSNCKSVGKIIDVPDRAQGQLIRELNALHTVTANGIELDRYPGIAVGARCMITHQHPKQNLRGMVGDVESRDGNHRFVLRIGVMGDSVCFEIDPAYLEPV